MGFAKGVAAEITATMIYREGVNAGQAITTGDVLVYITKDGGPQTLSVNSATHIGNGQWLIVLTAEEMDADTVGILWVHAEGVNVNYTIATLSGEELSPSSSPSTNSEINIAEIANSPRRVRTFEGTVEERSIDDLIKADQYLKSNEAVKSVPWGMRVARTKPGTALGG